MMKINKNLTYNKNCKNYGRDIKKSSDELLTN